MYSHNSTLNKTQSITYFRASTPSTLNSDISQKITHNYLTPKPLKTIKKASSLKSLLD